MNSAPTKPANRVTRLDVLGLCSLFAAIYFIQGISEPTEGLIAQPVRSLLRNWGQSADQIAWFSAWLALPWAIKPLYGFLADLVPLGGSRHRTYLVLANAATALALVGVFIWPPTATTPLNQFFVWLFIPTVGVAFADVVVDALMVERGQPHGLTGRLQSVQWGAMYAAMILTGYVGGWISQIGRQELGFLISGLCASVALVLTLVYVRDTKEKSPLAAAGQPAAAESQPARRQPRAFQRWWKALLRPPVLTAGAFLFLWSFNPFSMSVLYVHMTEAMGFDEQFYGETVSLQAVGAVVATVVYGLICRRVRFVTLVHVSIVMGMLATAAFFGMHDRTTARAVALIVGFTYMAGSLVQLDFTARACSQDAAATTFALLMSLSNLSLSLSTGIGGSLYTRWEASLGATPAFRWLIAIGAASTATCWLLTPALHRFSRAEDELARLRKEQKQLQSELGE